MTMNVFEREGEYWTIAYQGKSFRLKGAKGLRYLAELLHNPGREFHVLELASVDAEGVAPADLGDAGAHLDTQAKSEYRRRLDDLHEELQEAERFADAGRTARAREEIETLTAELSRASGLGGRDRRAGSPAERARLKLTMAIKGALRKIADSDPALGRHLAATVKTGRFCSYAPDSRVPPWGSGAPTESAARCTGCGFENGRGAKFCSGCGQPLVDPPATPEPRAYTPKHLAEKILSDRAALEGERKHVTVLFCGIKDSLDLSAGVDPEDWQTIVDRFAQITLEAVHRLEGTVSQLMGDRVVALFGAPLAHEDHAQRACHAALRIRDGLRGYATELRKARALDFSSRIGIGSGEVVVRKIGDDLRMEYTALGHTANVAARMEQVAQPNTVYLAETTAKLVQGFFQLWKHGEQIVQGVAKAVGVFELLAAGDALTSLQASERRGFTRFVGRAAEMRSLESALTAALSGEGTIHGVVGEPGIGKSRLCREFVRQVRERDIRLYEGHCPAHGKTVPYIPILELFRSYFGIAERDSAVEARSKIASTLLSLDESFREALPLVFEFLAVPDPDDPALLADPETKQKRIYAFLRALVRERSRVEPAVILVDDLHWVDAASDAFLAELVEAIDGTRTLCLVNFRPEYSAPWMRKSSYQQIALKPLGPREIDELVTNLVGQDPSASGLGELIRNRTGGNPFFIEETIHELAEMGKLEGEPGAYKLLPPLRTLTLPARVQAVLAGRIDRLDQRDKQTLQAAAVIGKNFPARVLLEVTTLEENLLGASLNVLREKEFLYEERTFPEAEYAFKHPLTHEVAYQSQLERRRRATHESVAQAIEKLYPEKLDERAALVAHHWESAGKALEAGRWHARAAQWAGVRDARAAVLHWTKVRELLRSAPEAPDAAALRILACSRMLQLGWRLGAPEEDLASVFREGTDLATCVRDRRSLVALLSGYGTTKGLAGKVGEYVEHGTKAFHVAQETNDPALILAIRAQLGYGLSVAGRFLELRAILEGGFASRPRDVRLGRDIVGYCPYIFLFTLLGILDNYTGRLGQAANTLDTAMELAREHSDIETLCCAFAWRSEGDEIRGDSEAALEHGRKGLEFAERTGGALWISHAHTYLARAYLVRQEWDEAVERLEQVVKMARESRTGLQVEPSMLAGLAEAYLGRGEATAARYAAEEAVSVAERGGMKFFAAVAELALARVLLRTDGARAVEPARQALDRALSRIEETGGVTYEPFVRLEFAELARLTGDAAVRERELREAHRLFLEIGAPLRAEQVAKDLAWQCA